jgi:tetratricopeptide (TPR) repeat protein
MKKLILLFTLCSFFIINAQDTRFEDANTLYNQEKYSEAATQYEEILATDVASAKLYFNLGNAYYKMGQIAPCILNYERAQQLAPNDKDIIYNLELVQQHVVDQIEKVDDFFLSKFIKNIRATFSSNNWARFSIITFALFIILLLTFLLSHSSALKKMSFYLGILLIILSITSFSFSSSAKDNISMHNEAIVFAPTVTVKSSPNDNGTDLFVLHEGIKITITDKLEGWAEIMLSDGNKGWLKTEAIEPI